MSNVRCWNCGMDFEVLSSAENSNKPSHIHSMPDAGTTDGINGHDVHCKSYYPHLIESDKCMWCVVIRRVRQDC
jgi:hypothetical protein